MLYAWGYNGDGQLGDGSTTDHHVPENVAIDGDMTPATIAAGRFFTLVITSTGPGSALPESSTALVIPIVASVLFGSYA